MINAARKISIGIIDIFGKKKGIPINGVIKDFTHGDMTSSVLASLTADLSPSITKIPVRTRRGSGNLSFDLRSLLKQLKGINQNSKNFDYLNISGSFPVEYSLFGLSNGGIELSNPETVKYVLSELSKVTYKNGQAMRVVPDQVEHIIQELERISNSGTKIFISSCNKSKAFNAFGLAKGVHNIGACDGVTKTPIARFSNNPLVESHQNLPIYITQDAEVLADNTKTALDINTLIPIESTLAKLSKRELIRKTATKKDYEKLKYYVDKLYETKKFKFDLDFFRFTLASQITKMNKYDSYLTQRIFDTKRFWEIFDGKLDEEVLKYTTPAGTHCDLMFRQFFDMHSKTKYVISMHKTTKIPNTLSGTSFAAPQGLNEAIRQDIKTSINYLS